MTTHRYWVLAAVVAAGWVGCPSSDDGAQDVGVEDPGAETLADPGGSPDLPTPADVPGDAVAGEPDSGADARERVLLVDFDLRPEITWRTALEALDALGYTVTYRRYYPHVTEADVAFDADSGEPAYRMILVGAGGGPGLAAPVMRRADGERLTEYVKAGGTVAFLTRHGWNDRVTGEPAWLHVNRLLETVGVPLRWERSSIIGNGVVGENGKPPLHLTTPAAYPGSLEWTLDLPIGYSALDHEALAKTTPAIFAASWCPMLSCDSDDVAVLARVHREALTWWDHAQTAGSITGSSKEEVIAAVAPAVEGDGVVALAPRMLFNIVDMSYQVGDKPVLDLSLLDATVTVGRRVLEHLSALAHDRSLHTPQGCSSGKQPLLSAAAAGLPPLGDGPEEQALYPVSERAVPATPPTPPAWAEAPSPQPSEATAVPTWFTNGRARLGYGSLEAAGTMHDTLALGASHGLDSYVISVDPMTLIDTGLDRGPSPAPWQHLAQAADQVGVMVYLGAHFWNQALIGVTEQQGTAVGAQGQELGAPSPLEPRLWDEVIRPLVLGGAKAAAADDGVGGIHIDMELYGANALWYQDGMAFDATSWDAIVAAIQAHDGALADEAVLLTLAERLPWLVDRGLVGFAYRALESEVATRAAALREEARAIAPDLELAFYEAILPNTWFYRGLMRGFGTADRPTVVLSYDIATERVRGALAAEGIHVRVLGGVLGVRFTPVDFEDAMYFAGLRSDGYWLFQMSDYPGEDDPAFVATKHGAPSAYWAALEAANARLEAAPAPP